MAIRVDKAVRIHETEIFRLVAGRAAGGHRFGDEPIRFFAALATEGGQNLDGLARVADDDARASIVGELRIGRKAECLEKRLPIPGGRRPGG